MNFNKYLTIGNILRFSSLSYLQAGISFLVAILLARHLGPDLYGMYTYGIVFNTSLFILIQFGLDKTLVRDLVQKENPAAYLLAACWIKFLLVIAGLSILLVWGFLMAAHQPDKVAIAVLFGISGCLFGLSPRAWFDYIGKIQLHASLLLLERILSLGGVGYLLFWAQPTALVVKVGIVLLVGRLLLAIFEWSYVYARIPKISFQKVRQLIRPLLLENAWVWLAAINNLLMTNANQIILDQKAGAEALGFYGFALQLIMLVQLMQGQLLRLATPSIAQTVQQHKGKKRFRKYLKDIGLCLGLTLVLLIPVYFLAPHFIGWLGGRDYDGALPVLRVLCIWSIVYGIALINNQYLLSFHLQKVFFWITLIFGLLSIGLVFYFIPIYGTVGAAFSLLVSHSGSVLVQSIFVVRKMKQHVNVTQPNKKKVISSTPKIKVT